jgi:hypothetical protein
LILNTDEREGFLQRRILAGGFHLDRAPDAKQRGPVARIEPPEEWLVVITGMSFVCFALLQHFGALPGEHGADRRQPVLEAALGLVRGDDIPKRPYQTISPFLMFQVMGVTPPMVKNCTLRN